MTNAMMTSELVICIPLLCLLCWSYGSHRHLNNACLASTKKNVRNKTCGPVETNLYTLQDRQKLLEGLLYSQEIC